MSNKIKGLTVAFEKDVNEEYAEEITKAIQLFDGVGEIKASISNSDDWINRAQVKMEFREKIYTFMKEISKWKNYYIYWL